MHLLISCVTALFIMAVQEASSSPLTVVPDKSGEQQVKEALKKAEQEAEKAAKEKKYEGNASKNTSKEEGDKSRSINSKSEVKNQYNSESTEAQDASDRRMKEMAAKLNSLVMKFQRKVIANKLHNALQRRVAQSNAGKKSFQGDVSTAGRKTNALDLSSLDPLAAANNAMATPYKEDTKLEDRLALEAEEEKKFNNGETYDEDGGYHDSIKSYAGTTSLSPKEQASQEMQRYNALISSESSRELSQIQDEISKATQTSMGKVSVEGENPAVAVDQASNNAGNPPLDLGGLGGIGQSNGLLGGNIGMNLGNQLEGASIEGLSGGQAGNFAGSVDTPGVSEFQTQDTQNLQSFASTGAGIQGSNTNAQTIETDVNGAQNLFNKKSKISKNSDRKHKLINYGKKTSRKNVKKSDI